MDTTATRQRIAARDVRLTPLDACQRAMIGTALDEYADNCERQAANLIGAQYFSARRSLQAEAMRARELAGQIAGDDDIPETDREAADALNATLRHAQIVTWADAVMRLIDEDIAAGKVPADVPDFAALHDYVDANMYIVDAMIPYDSQTVDGIIDIVNAVDDECDRRLRARLAG